MAQANDEQDQENQNQATPEGEAVDHLDEDKDDAALWDEIEQSETAAPDDDTPPAEAREDDDVQAAADEDDPASDSAAAAGDGDEPPPANAQSGEPSPDGGQPQDLWATATPEQRTAFEAVEAARKKLEQADRSNRGRLSALQRKLDELTQQAAPKDAAGKGDSKGMTEDERKALVDEYPELATPLVKEIDTLRAELTNATKVLAAIGEDRQKAALNEQAELLAEQHPDWEETAADPGFADWVHTQPRHIQEAAYRNADQIVDAAEAADVVGRFKQHRSQGGSAQEQNESRARDTGTKRLAGKRQRQLESASTARSRGPGAASGIPEDGDPETLWNQIEEMERRQARA